MVSVWLISVVSWKGIDIRCFSFSKVLMGKSNKLAGENIPKELGLCSELLLYHKPGKKSVAGHRGMQSSLSSRPAWSVCIARSRPIKAT